MHTYILQSFKHTGLVKNVLWIEIFVESLVDDVNSEYNYNDSHDWLSPAELYRPIG